MRLELLAKLAKIPVAEDMMLLEADVGTGLPRSVCAVDESNELHVCKDDGKFPKSPPEHNGVIVCKYEWDRASTARGAWLAADATFSRIAAFITVTFAEPSSDIRLREREPFTVALR